MRREEENLIIFLAKHDLESALNNIEKCDIRVPTLGPACDCLRKALKFVNEELELRRRRES